VRGARVVDAGRATAHAEDLALHRHRPRQDPSDPELRDDPGRHHDAKVPVGDPARAARRQGGRGAARRRPERWHRLAPGRLRPERAHSPRPALGDRLPRARGRLYHQGLPLAGLQLADLRLRAAVQAGGGHQAAGLAQRVRRDLCCLHWLHQRQGAPPTTTTPHPPPHPIHPNLAPLPTPPRRRWTHGSSTPSTSSRSST
jgi:hypothetical protein